MSSSVALYDALTSAPDDRARARVIAEAFERLEERYPHLPDLATQGHVRESELRLQKEIEQVRAGLRETELRLKKDIEQVRAELKADIEQVRAELKADIEQIRADLQTTELRLLKEIEQVRGEITRTKLDLLKWIVPLMLAQVAAIAALVKLL
ncbi:coiled-coil domain-containing protein [Thiocapsa bogorovii]|uniref:coiled-coil domain-containing protein n=1 Tax=Thiocapsa bogorovii TaxID=521689 RepID=UPI001E646CA0|nr:coiled-coil domain-containing protein [Thiocapsa bogorovii]UHD16862.1 CCDC90 family protein [Thiocapsa bogorovii]